MNAAPAPLPLQFIWMVLSAIFGAGVSYATMAAKITKAQTDVTRVADIGRKNDLKEERRWKHQIASQIEELEPKEKAHRIANLLREDAWRN